MGKINFTAAILTATVVAASTTTSAFAWHPKGVINKQVQNVTSNSALADANSLSAAVNAKPGDTLKYVITVSNVAGPAEKQYNDMAFTMMTDSLPAGVELVSAPSQRTVTDNMGLILPGKKVVKEFIVKVTANKDGQVIDNKACFTADSVVKDNPQKGCDNAIVKVSVPKAPVTPVEKPTEKPIEKPAEKPVVTPVATPAELPQEVLPAELPKTGGAAAISGFAGISALTYAAASYLQSRRR